MQTLQAQNGNWHLNNEQCTSITLMSCLAYSPRCHSAEVHSLSWYTVFRKGSSIQAGRQPRQMKAPEFIEHDNSPLPSSRIHKQIYIYRCKMLCLVVAADFLTDPFDSPFISRHFLSAGGAWTQTGGPCLGRKTLRVLTAKLQNKSFLISWYRFQGWSMQGCPVYIWSPCSPVELLWSLHKKWNQTVPNSALKSCRSTSAPALSSLRTRFYLLEIFGRQSQDGEYLHVSLLHSLCWEMLWNVNFSNDSSFKSFSVLSSFLINSREVILLLSMAATL